MSVSKFEANGGLPLRVASASGRRQSSYRRPLFPSMRAVWPAVGWEEPQHRSWLDAVARGARRRRVGPSEAPGVIASLGSPSLRPRSGRGGGETSPDAVQQTSEHTVGTVNAANLSSFPEHGALLGPRHEGLTRAEPEAFSNPNIWPGTALGRVTAVCSGLHQLSGPVGRSTNLHKTDIKTLSSRDAARRCEVVRVVSPTISTKCPTRLTRASPITR
jgi:hypothetical protein